MKYLLIIRDLNDHGLNKISRGTMCRDNDNQWHDNVNHPWILWYCWCAWMIILILHWRAYLLNIDIHFSLAGLAFIFLNDQDYGSEYNNVICWKYCLIRRLKCYMYFDLTYLPSLYISLRILVGGKCSHYRSTCYDVLASSWWFI